MPYEQVNTTKYRAKDRSLHDSVELAKKHDADRERHDKLFDIVSDAAWDGH